eukprot:6173591-Pleurochrysis_carterae.AAC.6
MCNETSTVVSTKSQQKAGSSRLVALRNHELLIDVHHIQQQPFRAVNYNRHDDLAPDKYTGPCPQVDSNNAWHLHEVW